LTIDGEPVAAFDRWTASRSSPVRRATGASGGKDRPRAGPRPFSRSRARAIRCFEMRLPDLARGPTYPELCKVDFEADSVTAAA